MLKKLLVRFKVPETIEASTRKIISLRAFTVLNHWVQNDRELSKGFDIILAFIENEIIKKENMGGEIIMMAKRLEEQIKKTVHGGIYNYKFTSAPPK